MPFNSSIGGSKVVPLYGGAQVPNPSNIVSGSGAPSSNMREAAVGDIYVNMTAGTAYMCVANTGALNGVTWAVLGGATADVNTLTGDSGTATPVAGNIQMVGGTGISTVGAAGTVTFNVVGGGLKTVVDATGPTNSPAVNTRIVPNTGVLLTINLPTVAAVGDLLQVTGLGAGGWILDAGAGDIIHTSGGDTSSGGTLASTNRYDAVTVVCVVANSEWVVEGMDGVLTIA